MRPYLSVLAILALFLLGGCPGKPKQADSSPPTAPKQQVAKREVVVWADPVLVKALTGLAKTYKKQTGSSYQVVAVERAARRAWAKGEAAGTERPEPDVLLFAGRDEFVWLLQGQKIDEASSRTFAGDRLVVFKPQGTTYTLESLFDIYKLRFKQLGVGDPEATTVGMYTHQALVGDGAEPRVKQRLQLVTDSTQLPLLPAQSKAKDVIAIGLASQAGGARGIETGLLIEASLHELLQYKAVAVAGKQEDEAVGAFLRWLAEEDSTQRALTGYGLLDRATALKLTAPAPKGKAAAPAAPTPTAATK
jgi:molybdenum ABC transporter molybdate-binding protein